MNDDEIKVTTAEGEVEAPVEVLGGEAEAEPVVVEGAEVIVEGDEIKPAKEDPIV